MGDLSAVTPDEKIKKNSQLKGGKKKMTELIGGAETGLVRRRPAAGSHPQRKLARRRLELFREVVANHNRVAVGKYAHRAQGFRFLELVLELDQSAVGSPRGH